MTKKYVVASLISAYANDSQIEALKELAESKGFTVPDMPSDGYLVFDGDDLTIEATSTPEGERMYSATAVTDFLSELPDVEDLFEDDTDSDAVYAIPVASLIIDGPEDEETREMEAKHIIAVENEKFGSIDIMSDGVVDLDITESLLSVKLG